MGISTTIVPWRTTEQFLKVYEYAYSEDISKKRWAVDQMDVWETRCWPALPVPVEATLFMVRANIQDLLFVADKSLCHAREVEMMYCTAIIRFINLLLERENNEGRILTKMAEKKNIPRWIVEVRHSATHGHCPSLPVLRMAYKTIMENLDALFWAPESTRISLLKKTCDTKPLVVLLQEYRMIQHQKAQCPKDELVKKALKVICEKLVLLLADAETRYEFLQILVHPNNFVTKEDINCLKEDEKRNLIEDNSGFLPITLRDFWSPVLEILHRYGCIPMFLELLLLSQEHRTIKIFQKVADYLVLYVVNLRYLRGDKNTPLKIAFTNRGPIYSYFRLLYSCMKGSSDSSKVVFDRLSTFLPLDGWTEELFAMLSIRQGLTVIRETGNKGQKRKFDITFTVEDLEEDIYAEMAKRKPELKKNHWSLAPIGMDFSNIQLGHIFNPVEKEKKVEKQQEVIAKKSSVEDSQMNIPVTEESMLIEAPKLANFIFERLPAQSYMVYQRKNKK